MSTSHQQIQILHVDDEPDFADLTGTFLEREDDRFTVETATSAGSGLERIGDCLPDCVVSDYNMPGMDGLEFLQAVRREYPDLPFILFTGKGSEEVASDALRAGATDYIQKQSGSERYELLANRVENAVEQYRSENRLGEMREEYATVFESAQDGLILVDVGDDEFRYQRCNPRAADLIGRDKTEIVGNTPDEALGPANAEKVVRAYRECLDQRESVEYTVTLDLPMGQVIREAEVTPVPTDGEVEQLVVEFRDVTERRQRQQELEEYGTVITALTDAVYVLDEEGKFTYVNDEFVRLVGYDRETILGSLPSLIKGREATEQAEQQLGRLLSSDGPETVTFEVTVHPRDGDPIVCEDHMGVLPYDGDQFNGSVGTLRNITDRRERKQELAQTHDLMANMEQLADVGAWEYDPDTETLVMTDGAYRIHGLNPGAELSVEEAIDNFHPDDRDSLADRFDECLETGKPYEIDLRLITAEGTQRRVTTRAERITDGGDGSVVRGYIQDITEQRDLEAEVAEILDRVSDAFFALDDEFRFTHVNDRAEELLQASEEDLLGETLWDMYPEAVETDKIWDGLHAAMETQEPQSLELGYELLDFWVEASLYPSESGVSVYLRDVTEEKEYERKLEAQNQRLEEFTSIVSHDLRSPLTVAEGNLELAQETCESDYLVRAADAVDRSQALVEDLLTLAREGETVGGLERVALADVVESSWQTVETGSATLETRATHPLQADRGRLKQLLENLYRNAVEHSDDNVTVSVGAMGDGFYVADTGPGVPESDREEIFNAGYSTSEDGTGFGLRIVEQIADAHGWEVAVTESEQGGARFEVTGVEFVDR